MPALHVNEQLPQQIDKRARELAVVTSFALPRGGGAYQNVTKKEIEAGTEWEGT